MKKVLLIIVAALILVSIIGCVRNENTAKSMEANANYPVVITDSMGRQVTINKMPERLVSGYYISTYMLVNLGLKDKIVGVESKADTRPVYRNFAPNLLSVSDVGTAKAVNVETVLSLDPDLVILPYQQAETAKKIEQAGIPAIVVKPEALNDFLYVAGILGKATGTSDKADKLTKWFNDKWKELEQKTSGTEKKKVYMCSSSDPLNALTPKMFQSEMIRAAGGTLVTEDIEEAYWAKISMEQLYTYKPDFMFISSGGDLVPESLFTDSNWNNILGTDKVFGMPSSVEGWDSPTFSSVLGAYYMACKMHPEAVSVEDVINLAKEYCRIAYDADVTLEQLGVK